MVVVLDDRSDVWSFSPNLIRIKPCKYPIYIEKVEQYLTHTAIDEFFIGIGDINNQNSQITQAVAGRVHQLTNSDK